MGWATDLRSLPTSNILDTTTREKLPNRILTEKEGKSETAHVRDIYLESCFLVIAGDRMSRGLRQKEMSRLGEVPGWAPGGLGAVIGFL